MRRFGIGLIWGIAGYFLVAVASYFLVLQFSPNQHDRDLEAAMTSVFFFGLVGGIAAFIFGLITGGKPRTSDTDNG